jgi:hypothetical protein
LDLANILQGFTDFINPADCVFVLYFGSGCGLCLEFSSDPGCKFIAEILADPDLDKAIAGSADFASNLGESADLYTPIYPPPLLIRGYFRIGTLPGRKITIQLLVNWSSGLQNCLITTYC